MKKFLIILFAALCSAAVVFGGCSDGQVTISNNYVTMTDEQWTEYIENLDTTAATKMQASINKSLMSGVSIITSFEYSYTVQNNGWNWGFGGNVGNGTTYYYHNLYSGSGVIVDLDKEKGDAYVITNCHVVYSDSSVSTFAENVYLYLYGQDLNGVNYTIDYNIVGGISYGLQDYYVSDDENYRIEAEIVGASISYDIALLKVTGSEVLKNSNAVAASFSAVDDVAMGQQVYAIGNPEGEGMSATMGVISKDSCIISLSLKDNVTSLSDYDEYRVIRTDAAINGGNSGGGLYNTSGELLGIINSKTESEKIDNMGYALPGSNVKRLYKLMRDAYESGTYTFSVTTSGVTRAYLPVSYSVVYTSSYLDSLGIAETVEVVSVSSVKGYKGDLQEGDILKHIKISDADGNIVEDRDITRTYHVDDVLLSVREGYSVVLSVQRGSSDGLIEIPVTCTFSKVK